MKLRKMILIGALFALVMAVWLPSVANASSGVSNNAAKAETKYKVYVVKEGDTLGKIARKFGVKVSTIVKVNKLGSASRIYVGQKLRIPVAAKPAADKEKTTRITLDVDFAEAGLKVGDLMRVTIVLQHKEDVLWLPPQAIRTFGGRKFVVVQEDGYQQRVDVKIGIESDDRVEIISGLEDGQVVIAP